MRAAAKEFLASKDSRGVWVEAQPAYALDLNPVEWAWQHRKHVELRNATCLDLEERQMQLHLAIARLRQKVDIVRSFFAGPGYHFETSDLCATLSKPQRLPIQRKRKGPLNGE